MSLPLIRKPRQTRKPRVLRTLLLCGIVAPVLYATIDIVGGVLWHGYSFASQAISELTAVGAPTRVLLVPLYPIYSLLMIAFGFAVWQLASQRRTLRYIGILQVSIGIVGLAWTPFPMHLNEPQTSLANIMHDAFAAIQVLQILPSISLGVIVLGKRFRLYSLGTLAAVIVGGILTFAIAGQVVPLQITNWVGVLERFNVYGYMIWVIVLAAALWRDYGRPMSVMKPNDAQEK